MISWRCGGTSLATTDGTGSGTGGVRAPSPVGRAAPPAAGNLRFFPGDGTAPNASALTFNAGQTRANNAIVMTASSGSGTFAFRNSSTANVHVVIDVNGYFE